MKLGVFHNQSQVDKLCATKVVRRQAYGDMRVRGLQLEILPTGTAKWRLRYRGVKMRRRSCLTLGSALVLSLNDARGIAEAHLRDVLLGKDPQEIKLATRQVPTFGEFINEQYMPYIKSYKRSWTTDQSILKNHLFVLVHLC